MGQNKLENQIKETLNTREIQPSAQAWDRLDAMLTVAEEKKTRKPFGFLFIAASVLVFVTLGMFFFSQKSTKLQPQNNIVGTEVKKDSVQKVENKLEIPIIKKNMENQVAVSNPTINHKPQTTNNNQGVSIINQGNQKQGSNQNQINKDKAIEFEYSSDVAIKDIPKIYTGSQIIVGSNTNAKSDEALLADLDQTAKQSANQKSAVKLDAKSLLSQVDGELELTFREKVINKVSKNYKEVKVALANRNNE